MKIFESTLKQTNFTFNSNKSSEENYTILIEKLSNAKKCATRKVRQKNQKKCKIKVLKPWFDDDVLQAIEMKQYYYNRKSKATEDKFANQQYHFWRNEARQEKERVNKITTK